MKYKNEIVIISIITILILFLKLINVFQIENGLGYPFIIVLMIICFSLATIFIQKNIDKNYRINKLNYQNLNILKYISSILIIVLHLRPFLNFSNELDLANVKRQEDTPCKHEIWICIGAFYEEYNPVGGRSYLKLHNNLEQDNFAYNGYVCIECGRTVYTKKWQEFESKHFVLKNLYDEKTYQYYMENNSCYYRDLYYQLLFTNPVEVAQQKVISEFNKNMEKTKILKKES